jgi:hypothetical protein
MFWVPIPVFGISEGVGSRFHVLPSRTRFRRYRWHRVPFSQEYSNQGNVRKESKDKARTQDVTEFSFNNVYVSGILNP